MRRCLLGWLLLFTVTGCGRKEAVEPIWVGQLVPLEGANRLEGQHARQGAQLAVADAEAAGQTVAGRPFAVLHVDSRGEAATVQAEAVRLVTVNRVAAFLSGFDAGLTDRLGHAAQPYGVPVVVPGEWPEGPAPDGVIALGVRPAERGRALAGYASGELKAGRAAVLTDSRSPVASALAAAFVKAWPRGGKHTVEEWTFASAAERDDLAARVVPAAPDVVLLACSVSDFQKLRSRLAGDKRNAPLLYGGPDVGAAPLQRELQTRPDVYLATACCGEHLTEAGRAFAHRYEERFHEPPDLFAAQSFDAARLLFEALQHSDSAERGPLEQELHRLERFDSVTGPIIWKDRQPHRPVFLVGLKDNQARVVKAIEPEG